MGRPENPVDRTVPARAELADFLRARKTAAGLTHQQMADRLLGEPSKATFERAVSGLSVPSWVTVKAFVMVTTTEEEQFIGSSETALALDLWIRARRATRAPYYLHKAPDPDLIQSVADLSRALRDQHVWAGFPTPGEMERTAGPGQLPSSTTRRIIQGRTLPASPEQAIAFLKACYVSPIALEWWIGAGARAFEHDKPHAVESYAWVKAHRKVRTQNSLEAATPLLAEAA